MRLLYILPLFFLFFGCNDEYELNMKTDEKILKIELDSLLTHWHLDAANANFDGYLGTMDSTSVFIGTDASENWNKQNFEKFCKPYFDKKTTWNFTAIERNIYLDDSQKFAWFDELLSTQMGICRGSGVIQKLKDAWKIEHYVLSMTIPNDKSKEVTAIKKDLEAKLLNELNGNTN